VFAANSGRLDQGELRSRAWSAESEAGNRLSDLLARRFRTARQALRGRARLISRTDINAPDPMRPPEPESKPPLSAAARH